MKEQAKGIVYDFKNAGWTVQKIEQELKFANGTLGKVINGKAGISEFKFSKLLELHQREIKKEPTVTEGLKEQIAENNKPENKEKIEQQRNAEHEPYAIRHIRERIGVLQAEIAKPPTSTIVPKAMYISVRQKELSELKEQLNQHTNNQ